MPDPLTSAMWSSWVEINPATAEKLGIAQGDVVEVTSGHGKVRRAAVISPGIAPDVIAMPAGQGHRTFTRYASGRGANPGGSARAVTEAATGALAWAATRVQVARVGPPDGRLILFAGGMREHLEGAPVDGRHDGEWRRTSIAAPAAAAASSPATPRTTFRRSGPSRPRSAAPSTGCAWSATGKATSRTSG